MLTYLHFYNLYSINKTLNGKINKVKKLYLVQSLFYTNNRRNEKVTQKEKMFQCRVKIIHPNDVPRKVYSSTFITVQVTEIKQRLIKSYLVQISFITQQKH